ncbi:hypothetical protein [Candidatus Albibeggiatoa sp. nov. NOAA]|uniref:hypothetical protein n=1 Tax=Candidatus Albibeggiatoa sp. nov. NOAA TaxID=3162724 RepID=UPI0032F1F6CD|nr:hypothetical protein [Thiotrichaceae bacterium]
MSNDYCLTVTNNSKSLQTFCIYQNIQVIRGDIKPVIWLTASAHPRSVIEFNWIATYDFIWIKPIDDNQFKTSQMMPADINQKNHVVLDFKQGAYTFLEPSQSHQNGILSIQQTSKVQTHQIYVGIGINGKSIALAKSCPNTTIEINPYNSHFFLALCNAKQGEFVDADKFAIPEYKLDFTHNDTLSVTLTDKNTWQAQ